MTAIEKLIDDQLRERTKLQNLQEQETRSLQSRQIAERRSFGESIELKERHEREKRELKQKQSQEGQVLFDRQEKEYHDLRNTLAIAKPAKQEELEQEWKAINARRAEERENFNINSEEFQKKDRSSLLEQLKSKWQGSRDKEKER